MQTVRKSRVVFFLNNFIIFKKSLHLNYKIAKIAQTIAHRMYPN